MTGLSVLADCPLQKSPQSQNLQMSDDPYTPYSGSPGYVRFMIWFGIFYNLAVVCLLTAVVAGLIAGPIFSMLYLFVLVAVLKFVPLHPAPTSWYLPNMADGFPSFVPAWWWYPLVAVLICSAIMIPIKNDKTKTRIDPREPSMLVTHLFCILVYALGSFMTNWLAHKFYE